MVGDYRVCVRCGMDALHEAGVCRFCQPRVWEPLPSLCEWCGAEFEPSRRPGILKRYCSQKCRHKGWDASDAGRAWKVEKAARQTARRAYMRELGITRNSNLERAA